MLVSGTCYVASATLMRQLGDAYSFYEITFIRAVLAVVILAPVGVELVVDSPDDALVGADIPEALAARKRLARPDLESRHLRENGTLGQQPGGGQDSKKHERKARQGAMRPPALNQCS